MDGNAHCRPVEVMQVDDQERAVRMMEQERRRFARDLNDGPVQVLSNTSMRLDVLTRMMEVDSAMAEEEIRRIRRRLGQAVIEIRQLIYDLQPVPVDEMGLVESILAMAHRLEQDWGLPVTVVNRTSGQVGLEPAVALMLFRAVQEACTNAAKHAQANAIIVTVDSVADRWQVDVEDDGSGFDVESSHRGHYGLGSMAERLELVSGQCVIQSTLGQGTHVRLTVPGDETGVAGCRTPSRIRPLETAAD